MQPHSLLPLALTAQKTVHGGRDGDGVVRPAVPIGVFGGAVQIQPFGIQPGARGLQAGQIRGVRWRTLNRKDHDGRTPRQLAVRGARRVQVVIKEPCRLVRRRLVGSSQGPGMLADQVVQAVAAADRFAEQVMVVKRLEHAPRGAWIGSVQCAGSVGIYVGARMNPEAAEHLLLAGGELLIGQVERGGDRQVLRRHQVQPVPGSGQVGGHTSRGPCAVVTQLTGEHPDRQGQVAAELRDLADCGVVRVHIGPSRQLGQQADGLCWRQNVQADRARILECRQMPPAGNQDQAAGGTGQQRENLLAVRRVIEQQQQLLPG